MTASEAKQKQDDIAAQGYDLSYWYGTNCRKCCGVYPKFRTSKGLESYCWYECEVCGKRTENATMPWIAETAWNIGEFKHEVVQMSLF